jgi:hypothetical protein
MGGNSFGHAFTSLAGGSGKSPLSGNVSLAATSGFADAILSTFAIALSGALIVLVIAIIILLIVVSIVHQSLIYYVFEHFYAILRKKKVSPDWKGRMQHHAIKSIIFLLFWAILFLALIGIPFAFAFVSPFTWVLSVVLICLAIIILFALGFFLHPLWIYYVLDDLPLSASISKSISLVRGSIKTFLLFAVIDISLIIGAAIAPMVACCFAYVISPLFTVFVLLLSGVALMKIKLALEAAGQK